MANGTLAASQIEMLSLSGTGIITITPPATNTNRAITLPDAAGAIVVSGTTPSLNGITFPATQVPSADANTLDDYEEGTFTPTLIGNSTAGTTTYVAQNALYVKIGRQVTVSIDLEITGTTGTGTIRVGGLPFTATSGNSTTGTVMVSLYNWSAGSYLVAFAASTASALRIFACADDVSWVEQSITNEAQDWKITITYFV